MLTLTRAATVSRTVAIVLTLGIFGAAAGAQSTQPAPSRLLLNTHAASRGVYGGLHYGGGAWREITSLIDGTFGSRLTTVSTLADGAALLGFDALWVDQRYMSAPTAVELANLQAFIATGRRTVIVGENASWGPWNAAVLSAVGGREGPLAGPLPNQGGAPGPGCEHGPKSSTVFEHVLLRGVASVNTACAGFALGGTALFDYNVATLWGPTHNVLTILDANTLGDLFGSAYDGRQFRANVVSWVGGTDAVLTAVPEPSALALTLSGLVACVAAARCRRPRRAA